MKTRFYYTFNELLNTTGSRWVKLFGRWDCSIRESAQTNNLFDYVSLEYGDDFVAYIDVEHAPWEAVYKPSVLDIMLDDDLRFDMGKQIRKIAAWLTLTKDKYEPLIVAFDSNKNNLMADVESTSTMQYNDTPQTTNMGLDSDEYASTYTKNKSASQMGTKIARINEIAALIESYNKQWVNEFGKMFVIIN